ncbi:MAG TPA: TPM domain-containing protein, partial [Thermoanaerobaculia bacterium]
MRVRHSPCLVLSLFLLLVPGHFTPARTVTVEQIPSPRPTGWAVDLTGTLPPERLAELNSLGDEVKVKTGAEMAVVLVGSTDGVDSHEFATRLFNAWGIGQSGKNNGLLVFAALADHRAEIVLGRGLDDGRNRGESAVVMRDVILPRFRAG